MNGLTFAQHMTALLDIILVLMVSFAAAYILLAVLLWAKDTLTRKIDDRIQYDDDERAQDFLAEVYIENGSEEDQS